jgi:hypothetical protein
MKSEFVIGDHVAYNKNSKYEYVVDEVETLSNGVKNYHLIAATDETGRKYGIDHWQYGRKLVFVR